MKTYEITIDMFDESGLEAISLVENPAVEYNFIAFSEPIQLQFTDEEKHIITGISILADTPILRITPTGEKYQVVFSKDTIRQLVEKYSKLQLNNEVNIDHNDRNFVDGVTMIESYIIDKGRGICPIEFQSAPDGSWITSFKVENEDVWNKIKNGEVRGFSVQGLFDLVEQQFSKSESKNKIKFSMKLKQAIQELLLKFNSVETDKGILEWNTDGQLEVGDEVFMNNEIAPDGEYRVDDKIFIVIEGKIAEVRDTAVPNEEGNKAVEEALACGGKNVKLEEVEPTPEEDPRWEDYAIRIASLEEKIKDLVEKLAELSLKPVAEPIVEEFEKVTAPKSTGNSKLDKQIALARALREIK